MTQTAEEVAREFWTKHGNRPAPHEFVASLPDGTSNEFVIAGIQEIMRLRTQVDARTWAKEFQRKYFEQVGENPTPFDLLRNLPMGTSDSNSMAVMSEFMQLDPISPVPKSPLVVEVPPVDLKFRQSEILAINLAQLSNERIRRIKTRVRWTVYNTSSQVAMSLFFKSMRMRIPQEWLENE